MDENNKAGTQSGNAWTSQQSNIIKKWMRVAYVIFSFVILVFYIYIRELYDILLLDPSTNDILKTVSYYLWLIGLVCINLIIGVLAMWMYAYLAMDTLSIYLRIFRTKTKAKLSIPISIVLIIMLEVVI